MNDHISSSTTFDPDVVELQSSTWSKQSCGGDSSSNGSESCGEPSKRTALEQCYSLQRPTTNERTKIVLRWLFSDLPLIASFALYLTAVGIVHVGNEYLIPQIKLQHFSHDEAATGLTYYHRICDASDQSAHDDPAAFTIQSNMSTTDAVDIMLRHGVSVIPNLMQPATASALRDFILAENARAQDLIYVIENEHRWSFPMRVDQHPSVTAALEELLNHPVLVDILEAVMGHDPAVIEFTAITQEYGAKRQYWHEDVTEDGNAAKHARNFVPSYALFVPLQDVTDEMGATGVCPGTHLCSEGPRNFCQKTGFSISGTDNHWAMGAGALVNQQLTHRGGAHVDPDGPQRVLFILTFAPRPQIASTTTSRKKIETRLIGLGGSYSLHWSHWGHTLSDYQRPLLHMRHPWRTLRSLGLYKPDNRLWGWDYVTVASGRIANEEFDEFDGGLSWLPRALQGDVGDWEDVSWVSFLQATANKCRHASATAYEVVAVTYIAAMATYGCFTLQRLEWWKGHTARLFAYHAAVLLLARLATTRLRDSSWGRNIVSKRSFSLVDKLTFHLNLSATLPTKHDVLMTEAMKSNHFSSYSRILETAHPGNTFWSTVVEPFVTGYGTLSPGLQRHVQDHLVNTTRHSSRRFLVQTLNSNWAVAPDDVARWFCHKSLLQRSNSHVNVAVESLDRLLSEIRYGFWRSSAMHIRHVSRLVVSLRDDILGIPMRDVIPATMADARPSPFAKIRATVALSRTSARLPLIMPNKIRASLPDRSALQAMMFMQENDIVEAVVDQSDDVWYRGRIAFANSNQMTWGIVYDDEEVGLGLCLACVRPYVPYAFNDSVEVLVDEEHQQFAAGRVVSINQLDGSYEVRVEDSSGKLLSNVKTKDLRRRLSDRGN